MCNRPSRHLLRGSVLSLLLCFRGGAVAMVRMGPAAGSTPPRHAISAQRAAARLEEYEKEMAKSLLPPDDPVENFYKPVDPQAHSYHPRLPIRSLKLSSSGPSKLRVPRMFQRYEQTASRPELDVAQVRGRPDGAVHTRGARRQPRSRPCPTLPHPDKPP